MFGIRKEDVKIVLDILFGFIKWTLNGWDPFLDDIDYGKEKEEQGMFPVQEESNRGHNGGREEGSSIDNPDGRAGKSSMDL